MPLNKILYLLQWADTELILGHRLSEWTGHGPVLEQDIAITNIALDHIGQARNYYQYIATLIKDRSTIEAISSSPMLLSAYDAKGSVTEDDLAYLRDGLDYHNVLLVEQPNGDWAYTIVRSFLYDTFTVAAYTLMTNGSDEQIAAIAAKSLKEAKYHLRWSSEWMIRLGDGTPESHTRLQAAIKDMWVYSGELTMASEADQDAASNGYGADLAKISAAYQEGIQNILALAQTPMPPADVYMHTGGKMGRHGEHLGYLLAEMQYLQRAYPGQEW